VAQWSYIRPILQAYVTHSRPLGCTRSSPGHVVWTGSHQAGSGHMSPLDPFLGRVWVFFAPESRDPAVSSPDPTQKVWDPSRRSVRHVRGSGAFFAVGPDLLRVSWSTSLSLPRGDPGAVDVARLRTGLRATRDLSAGVVPSYCGKGYPCFRVPTAAIPCSAILISSSPHCLSHSPIPAIPIPPLPAKPFHVLPVFCHSHSPSPQSHSVFLIPKSHSHVHPTPS
jgi:hypothetical protein